MNDSYLFNFDKDSNFVIDLRAKNLIAIFEQIIHDYEYDNNNDNGFEGLKILPKFKEALLNFNPNICILNDKLKTIQEIINNWKKRENMSLKRICRKYRKKMEIK